jgi:outer membrane protein
MNRLVVACAVLALVLGAAQIDAAAAAESDKFAFVDLQRALEETNDGKAAKAKLKTEFERKQKELNDKTEELKKMKEALDKKSALMKEDALRKEGADLQQRFMQLQETYNRLQGELQTKEQDATRGILQKLQMVVAKIAEREHFVMVFERQSSVVWGQPSLDITNEVIRMYNSSQAGASTQKSK